jgi:isopentenyl phosphate kinase
LKARPIILKLGGSVIAPKIRPFKIRTAVIKRLAREIKEAGVSPLITIHGGGGLPHHLVTKYGLGEGYKHPSQLLGFSEVRKALMALNKVVIDALVDQGLPAVNIQPSACCFMNNGRLSKISVKSIEEFLKRGLLPVLHGDIVLDTKRGFGILSGDELLSKLALDLHAQRVVVGVDVDGLHVKDPTRHPDAELIEDLTAEGLESLRIEVERSRRIDVTGGMARKMAELLPVVKKGVPVFITNASKPGRVLKALKEEEVLGTLIHP